MLRGLTTVPRRHDLHGHHASEIARGSHLRRNQLGLVCLLVVLATAAVVSLAFGSKQVDLQSVFDALFQFHGTEDETVVRGLRLPRTELAVAVGVALGLSGVVMQAATRNPIADPGLLGVNSGAALAVVLAIYTFGVVSPVGFIWFAFVGAFVTSAVVYTVGSAGRDGATPVKLALAGAGVTALVGALTNALLLGGGATLASYRFWAVGSLAGRSENILFNVLPFLSAGVILAFALGVPLNVLSLGDETARSLGQRVGVTRAVSVATVLLLVGASVSAAGPIAFVGLMVPHAARAIVGPDYRWVMPYSAVLAAILVICADVLGRAIARPGEIEVSVVTAVIGTPFLVMLIRRRRVVGL
ncbi:MAG: iron ABC transporter permease [Chloroflexi bacterium]|nr:iron ABC transporter permease [Chloroflexota bacterium]